MNKNSDPIHTGVLESSLSAVGGVLLMASALRRRGLLGVVQAAVGGCLLWRGVTAWSELSGFPEKEDASRGGGRRRAASRPPEGRPRASSRGAGARAPAASSGDDAVTECSEESFPASDPPSWSPGHV